ncbi:hypothetical protein FRC06_009080 [Ceratobasidium sp. 370]|nr:hypothetical protein FRC06_009080 [Ceratobasidium sp. 370]
MDEPWRIWVSMTQPTIFQLTITGETVFMSMWARHTEVNKACAEGRAEEEAFVAGYKHMQEMGSFHVGVPQSLLAGGPWPMHSASSGQGPVFAPVINHGISSGFAKWTLCGDEIGGVTCRITLMSALKLHHLTHVMPSDLTDWKIFMTHVDGHIPEIHEIHSTGSELMDDLLEDLLEAPGPDVLCTNLSHLVTQDLLDSIGKAVKVHQPEMMISKGTMGQKIPPWVMDWDKQALLKACGVLDEVHKCMHHKKTTVEGSRKAGQTSTLHEKIVVGITNPKLTLSVQHHINLLHMILLLVS